MLERGQNLKTLCSVKQISKKRILHDSTYMKYLEKSAS